MKYLILGAILVVSIPLAIIMAQQDEPDSSNELEAWVKNNYPNASYTITIQNVGATWSRCIYGYPLVGSFPGAADTSTLQNFYVGLGHIENTSGGQNGYFGYGKYRIQINEDLAHCYIDFTTCNYPYGSGDCYGPDTASNDVFFYYYADSALFKIKYNGEYSNISDGQTFTIWDLSGVSRDSICFKPDVVISGPSTLDCDEWFETVNTPPGYADYTSTVSHGSGSYNYYWEKRYEDSEGDTSNWSYVGNSSIVRTAYNTTWMWMEVRLTVGDPGTGFSNQDTKHSSICDGAFEKVSSKSKDKLSRNKDFIFTQNYPNPFNPSTTLIFNLPSDEFVNITIFNTYGSEVANLFSGQLNAGQHHVTWDGRNNTGQAVSSGIYFCRFKSFSYTKTIKMLLMK